jgi:hypothetical protein
MRSDLSILSVSRNQKENLRNRCISDSTPKLSVRMAASAVSLCEEDDSVLYLNFYTHFSYPPFLAS